MNNENVLMNKRKVMHEIVKAIVKMTAITVCRRKIVTWK